MSLKYLKNSLTLSCWKSEHSFNDHVNKPETFIKPNITWILFKIKSKFPLSKNFMFFFLDTYIPINGKQHLKLYVHVFCFSWAHDLEVQDFFLNKIGLSYKESLHIQKGRAVSHPRIPHKSVTHQPLAGSLIKSLSRPAWRLAYPGKDSWHIETHRPDSTENRKRKRPLDIK